MRRRITRALLVAMAAGVTITSLSLAAEPASAAQGSAVVNVSSSGWAAGNVLAPGLISTSSTWNFRYASGMTVLPDLTAATGDPVLTHNVTQEVFSVQLSNLKATFAAQMYATAAGAWHVQFVKYYQNGTAADDVAPAACNPATTPWTVGTQVRLDVYYSQGAGTITFTAYSGPDQVCTFTTPAWDSNSLGGGSFREAFTGAVLTPPVGQGAAAAPAAFAPAQVDPPPTGGGNPYTNGLTSTPAWARPAGIADSRLFAVSGVHFTSYNGTKGTVIGPWAYQQLIFGTSTPYNVYVSSPVLWNGGQNFGVWVRV